MLTYHGEILDDHNGMDCGYPKTMYLTATVTLISQVVLDHLGDGILSSSSFDTLEYWRQYTVAYVKSAAVSRL
jgi:hypothetical protein